MAFIPGAPPTETLPLDRFLPPVPSGSALHWLDDRAAPGSWVLDPFGASPRLALELARAGYRTLIAANNPVTRFIVETLANRPSAPELTTALAHLASSRTGDERLEPHLLGLYHTPCSECGSLLSAEEFLWEREAEAPFARIYRCPHCGDEGEHPATPFDADLAKKSAATKLNYARILERVAGLGDPDRKYAEEAIQYYPPRAVYALGILVNKLETFPPEDLRLLSALYLTAFDRTNTLWPYPVPRPRPRQLTVPPRFREYNVFKALENAIPIWAGDDRPGGVVPLAHFPDLPPESGGICVFQGAVRDLAEKLPDMDIRAVVTVLPRPNQAFWKLSALWAGWLGGREAVRPFKPVLRRQRYDWRWHTSALHAALAHFVPRLDISVPYFALCAEAETGLLGAGLIAAEGAGLALRGLALRTEAEIGQVEWLRRTDGGQNTRTGEREEHTLDDHGGSREGRRPDAGPDSASIAVAAAASYLAARGEPAPILPIAAAVLQAGAVSHPPGDSAPADDYAKLTEILETALTYRTGFLRYNAGKELEVGTWWLRDEPGTVPLGDRVEALVREHLQAHPGSPLPEIDRALCAAFTGLLTPDHDLVAACVESYGVPAAGGGWQLRSEDDPVSRKNDVRHNRGRLIQLGETLGFDVLTEDGTVRWVDADGIYLFHFTTTAEIGTLLQTALKAPGRKLVVLPGSRANLVLFKRRRDPRLDFLLKDWVFLKFRHLRALSANPLIDRANLDAQFLTDELTYESPQLKLF